MKRALVLFIAAITAFSCQTVQETDVTPVIEDDGVTYLHASLADIGTKATNTKVGSFLWAAGDALSVYDGSFHGFSISDGVGTASATFSGTLDGSATLAVYPAIGKSVAGNDVTVTLPDSYSFTNKGVQMPMVATVSGSDLSFTHLGAILKFDVYGIPASADRFVFAATDKRVSGDFTFDSSESYPSIATEADVSENTVTVTFTAGTMTSASFYIPVPVGTYSSGFSVALKNGDDVLITKNRSSSITLSRGQYSIQSAFDCGTRTSTEIWSGSFDTANWDRLDLRNATTWNDVANDTYLVLTVAPDATNGSDPLSFWRLKVEDGWMGDLPEPIWIHLISGQTEASVKLSAANLAQIKDRGGIYISGGYVTISSVKLVRDTRTYSENCYTIWNNASSFLEDPNSYTTHNDLAWGGFNWSGVEAGSVLRLGFSLNPSPAATDWWAIRLGKGSDWSNLTEPIVLSFESGETSVDIKLTQNNIDCINNNEGLVIVGTDVCLESVQLVTTTQSASKTVIWSGNWSCSGWDYITDLLSDKFTWTGLSGKTIRFMLTPASGAQFSVKHLGGGWQPLTDHPNQSVPIYRDHVDITLTDTDITEINTNGGIIVTGDNYTLTEVAILK